MLDTIGQTTQWRRDPHTGCDVNSVINLSNKNLLVKRSPLNHPTQFRRNEIRQTASGNANMNCKKGKGKYPNLRIASKDFMLYSLADLLNRIPSRLFWEDSSHAVVNARTLLLCCPSCPMMTSV